MERPSEQGTVTAAALLAGSVKALWSRPTAFITAAALPFAVQAAFIALFPGSAAVRPAAETVSEQMAFHEPARLAAVLVACLAIVLLLWGWMRLLLADERPRLLPRLGPSVLAFLPRALLLLALGLGPALPFGLVADRLETSGPAETLPIALFAGTAIVFCAALYAALRCSMTLPATARGRPMTLGASWRMTRGRTARLFLAVAGAAVILALLVGLPLQLLLGEGTNAGPSTALRMAGAANALILAALVGGILCHAFTAWAPARHGAARPADPLTAGRERAE